MCRLLSFLIVMSLLVSGCAAQKNRNNEQQWSRDIQANSNPSQVKTTEMKDRLRITIEERTLYASGQAGLTKAGKSALDSLIPTLKQASDHRIEVDGYTDDIPFSSHAKGKYRNNWELSAARAAGVVQYLQQKGIDPARMTTVGHGQYAPSAENTTLAGRAENRHTVIDLIPDSN